MNSNQAEPRLSAVHATAIGAALMRAAHLLRAAEPKIFEDRYALALANATTDRAIKLGDANARNGGEMFSAWVLRSRYAEDRLAAARARTSQYIVLGAGLDSFSLRMAGQLRDLTIFEVDDPCMQEWKRWRLSKLGLSPPPQLRFVPCDFEKTSLSEALAASGYNERAPTFVSWLGVTQYLTENAIRDILDWTGRRATGSEIVLSFSVPGAKAEYQQAVHAKRGLQYNTFFSPERMTELLVDAGFGRVEHLTPEQAEEIYYKNRSDGLHAPTEERLVAATVV